MTTGTLQDRRRFAQFQLEAMASQPSAEHPDALRQIAASVLGFTPVNNAIIAVDHAQLPDTATVVGSLGNEFGPDYLAVHFDLSALRNTGRRDYVTLVQVQAANDMVQRYAGDQRYPLLIFTLPDDSGVQFVTGDLVPSKLYRLQNIIRVAAYWGSTNRTSLDCLEQVGNDIATAGVPQRAFRNGFNVQPVTEAFFQDYKAAYDEAVKLIAADIGQADAEQFTQTLFNRLLFIQFASRKGWLRFEDNADYLNELYRVYRASPNQNNFYMHRLRHVFFAGLNNPQSINLKRDNPEMYSTIGDVPFLNGGLFEPTPLDDSAANGVFIVPDNAIAPLLTDLFNRYNFTVMEATPLDTEVAVDPEMLGKLFEETVNERHSNGAYYTPRPVVAFMCREAIKGYLAGQNIPGLDDTKITDLVDNSYPQAITVAQALDIANALADLKAIDPACGSGAFLLGMLQEIVALNDTLFRAGHTPESLYQQKLDIISNNIYGVDKDRLAVGTAMLRLWLSLAVDFEGEGSPAPLPNLDMKLMDGDAVAGPDPQRSDFTLHSINVSDLKRDIAEYTTARGQRKAELKDKVTNTKLKLRNSIGAPPADVIEWRIDFADVVLNGGFDVVIANPPYVRQEEIGANKTTLVKQYANTVTAQSDLYCYFYARGLQLLADGGMHVFVCSNSWLDVRYGVKLQEHLVNHAHVQAIYDSAVERQFATADINTVISIIRKVNQTANGDLTKFVSLKSNFDSALNDPAYRRETVRDRADLRSAGTSGGKFTGDKWGGKYLRAPDIYHHIMKHYGDKLVRLDSVASSIKRGITTGANGFFQMSPDAMKVHNVESRFLQPIMTSPQESKSLMVSYEQTAHRLFVCNSSREDLAGTSALKYIQWGESQGFHQGSTVRTRQNWYDLGNPGTAPMLVSKMNDTTVKAFLTDQTVHAANVLYEVHCPRSSLHEVCCALNSTLGQLMANLEGRVNFGGGMLELAQYELASILIVQPELITPTDSETLQSEQWDASSPSIDRRRLDEAIFDAIALNNAERDAVYEAVFELVGNRKRKAVSTQKAGRTK